jgi:hypothetical protein
MMTLSFHNLSPIIRSLVNSVLRLFVPILSGSLLLGCLDRELHTGVPTGIRVDKSPRIGLSGLDLLFVIDDSISMGDKQTLLRQVLPQLLRDEYQCVMKPSFVPVAKVDGGCPKGSEPEPWLPADVHIGIVTTSLEAGGACLSSSRRAHLVALPEDRGSITEFDIFSPGSSTDETLRNRIAAVSETGCGFEAPLEAWYRFLVDPDPPANIMLETRDGALSAIASGVDEELLAQRKRFLRPNSLLAIVILTDEDDCSVREDGPGALMAAPLGSLPHPASACADNPKDRCCRSCGAREQAPPMGCLSLAEDPACAGGATVPEHLDHVNLRCFDQQRRFGTDVLYPAERYITALTSPRITDRSGKEIPNPLFAGGRGPDMVSLAVIAGVPWQSIATAESKDSRDALTFLDAQQLDDLNVWQSLLGNAGSGTGPMDPHLIQSVEPRIGLAPPTSGPRADPIHGHEFENPQRAELQHSCSFELPMARDCSMAVEGCECGPQSMVANSPLCQANDGTYGTIQLYAKAVPPTRILEVVRGVGQMGVLGSICAKRTDSGAVNTDAFAYAAVLNQLMGNRIRPAVGGKCITRVASDADGTDRCKLIEIVYHGEDCNLGGRTPAPPAYAEAVVAELDVPSDLTFCELPRLPGDPRTPGTAAYACANGVVPDENVYGYCFIDPSVGVGNPVMVQDCPQDSRRTFRMIPANMPRPGARVFAVCNW